MFDLENLGHVTKCIRSDATRRRKPASVKVVPRVFTLTFGVSEILRYEMFDHENLVQGHGEQH